MKNVGENQDSLLLEHELILLHLISGQKWGEWCNIREKEPSKSWGWMKSHESRGGPLHAFSQELSWAIFIISVALYRHLFKSWLYVTPKIYWFLQEGNSSHNHLCGTVKTHMLGMQDHIGAPSLSRKLG